MTKLSVKEREEIAMTYGNFMDEVRVRLRIVETTLALDEQGLIPAPGASDLCSLQFRKICEAIAVGCLAAHGDIPAAKSKNLGKMYRADKLIKALEKLHPDFYPIPCTMITLANGTVINEPVKDRHLSKAVLIALYFKMDEEMHVGGLDSRTHQFHPINRPSIAGIVKLIRTLLSTHYIQFHDPDYRMIVNLNEIGKPVTMRLQFRAGTPESYCR